MGMEGKESLEGHNKHLATRLTQRNVTPAAVAVMLKTFRAEVIILNLDQRSGYSEAFTAFVSPSRKMLGSCLKLYNKHFLPHLFQFIIH